MLVQRGPGCGVWYQSPQDSLCFVLEVLSNNFQLCSTDCAPCSQKPGAKISESSQTLSPPDYTLYEGSERAACARRLDTPWPLNAKILNEFHLVPLGCGDVRAAPAGQGCRRHWEPAAGDVSVAPEDVLVPHLALNVECNIQAEAMKRANEYGSIATAKGVANAEIERGFRKERHDKTTRPKYLW